MFVTKNNTWQKFQNSPKIRCGCIVPKAINLISFVVSLFTLDVFM